MKRYGPGSCENRDTVGARRRKKGSTDRRDDGNEARTGQNAIKQPHKRPMTIELNDSSLEIGNGDGKTKQDKK